MRVVVTDVSVFFDLFEIQILPEFFGLDWEIHTTDFVYNEILRAGQRETFEVFKRGKQLNILSFSSSEEKKVRDFKTNRSMQSIADKTILWKAIELGATLLTCDKKLKKEAIDHKLEVRGSIWVIQQLVKADIINKTRGIELLENLKITNNRLPMQDIDKLIRQWKT